MRILVDCHVFDGAFQGSRTYLEGLYKAVFAIEDKQPSQRIYFLAAQDITSLKQIFPERDYIRFIQLSSSRSFPRLVFDFPRIIREYKIDYAHFQYLVPFSGRCRYINTIHDLLFLEYPEQFSWLYKAKRKWLFRQSFSRSAYVLTDSSYSAGSIRKFYGDSKPVTVIPLGMEDDWKSFVARYSPNEWHQMNQLRPYILFISRFEPRKNHHLLLQSFYEGGFYRDHDLVLIGKRSEPVKDFDELLASLPMEVQKRVIVKSEGVEKVELMEYVAHAKVFIYPSLAEGFGIPPLEAALLHTPVICSDTTSMRDFTFFGEGLTDCGAADKITAALGSVLREPDDLRAGVLQEIREKVLEKYNWNRNAEVFIDTVFPGSR